MKHLQINDQELITALGRMAPETGSLLCLGCGHEHKCCTHGCAVLRTAVDRLKDLSTPPPNPPLTLEELREMDGDAVWICDPDGSNGMWALVDLEYALCRTAKGGLAIFDTYGKTWLAYRRKPEEDDL